MDDSFNDEGLEDFKRQFASESVAYLAESVGRNPKDRSMLLALAMTLGELSCVEEAARVFNHLGRLLIHQGSLLDAMTVIRYGLDKAPDSEFLLASIHDIYARGTQVQAGTYEVPVAPPAPDDYQPMEEAHYLAANLLDLAEDDRFARAVEIATHSVLEGEGGVPLPIPLFCDVDETVFKSLVKHLRCHRVDKGTVILTEGEPGDSLIIITRGHVNILQGGVHLAKVGTGIVLGEVSVITGGDRSATAVAHEEVDYFELTRADIDGMAEQNSNIKTQLRDYYHKRLKGNVLNMAALFEHFDDFAQYSVIDQFEVREFELDAVLIGPDERAPGMYVVANGEAQICSTGAGDPAHLIKVTTNGVVSSGCLPQVAGETFVVRAAKAVVALYMSEEELEVLLAAHPRVVEYLAEVLETRLEALGGDS